MNPAKMNELIEAHIAAETAGDAAASVAMHTDDVEHDVVGTPHGALRGKDAARRFYEQLMRDIRTEQMIPLRSYYGEDFCVIEHEWTGTVPGTFLGAPGHGRRITFRLLHVFEFRDGLISRENAWLDGASVMAQLTADDKTRAEAIRP